MVAMARRTPSSRLARLAAWRGWIQAAFLLVWLNPWLVRMHTVCSPVFHCYSCPLATFACPIGVIANFSALGLVPWIAIGTVLATGAIFGSLVCGWACPFGFVQDLVARAPTPKLRLPAWLGVSRYLVLAGLVVAVPYFYGESSPLFFCRLCPAGALEAAVPNAVQQAVAGKGILLPGTVKLVVLGLFVTAALFTWRPWCTLFCPLGAIYGLCNRGSLLFVRFRQDQCNDCDVCHDRCHYGPGSQRRAGETRCIRCLECFGCRAIGIGTVLGGRSEADTPADAPVAIGGGGREESSTVSEI